MSISFLSFPDTCPVPCPQWDTSQGHHQDAPRYIFIADGFGCTERLGSASSRDPAPGTHCECVHCHGEPTSSLSANSLLSFSVTPHPAVTPPPAPGGWDRLSGPDSLDEPGRAPWDRPCPLTCICGVFLWLSGAVGFGTTQSGPSHLICQGAHLQLDPGHLMQVFPPASCHLAALLGESSPCSLPV